MIFLARGRKAAAVNVEPVEGPWDLPDGWRWEPLGAVSTEPLRGAPASRFSQTFRYLDVSSIDGAHIDPKCIKSEEAPSRARQFVEAGDTVLSGVRVYLRNIAMVPDDQVDVASTAFCVLRPGPDLDAKFMHRWISSDWFINALIPLQRGNSPPAVLDADVRGQPVPVPPLDVQRVIAARIDALFAEIDEGEAALAEARAGVETYRKALLKAAVTGELTADWRAANPPEETGEQLLARILVDRRARWHNDPKNARKQYTEPAGPDMDGLPELPEGWAWASVQQLSTLVTSGSRGWSEFYADSGSLFIRAANLNQDRLDLSEVAFVQVPNNSEGARTKVVEGDFLITITGANVTKCGVVTEPLDDAYVSQHVGLVRPVTPEIGRYLYLWSRAYGGGKQYLEDAAYGAGKPGLNLPNIYEMAVALPSPAEMVEIEQRVQLALDRVPEADFVGPLGGQLRQSILAAAFRGDLAA